MGSGQPGGFQWFFPGGLVVRPWQSVGIYGMHSTGVAFLDMVCTIEESN